MRRTLGSAVQYFERDRSATVDFIPDVRQRGEGVYGAREQ